VTFYSANLRDQDGNVLQPLPVGSGKVTPGALERWAKERGLPIRRTDSAWSFVDMTGVEVLEFLAHVLGDDEAARPEVKPDGRYTIEAEEF
jgi:hypothetical protein